MTELTEAIQKFTDYLAGLDAADLTDDERSALRGLKSDLEDVVRDPA